MRFVLIALFIAGLASAQNNPSSPHYSYCNWNNTSLNKLYTPAPGDTCLYVVSTRHYHDTLKEFLDYDYDTTAQLKYFAVYFQGNHWIAVPKKDLEDLLQSQQLSKDLVVYTEGLGRTFNTAVDRGTKMMRQYAVQTLLFDWPTERPYMRSGKNFRMTLLISEKVAIPYARFAESLAAYKTSHPDRYASVNLFFHSMGNLILMHALQHHYFSHIAPNTFNNVVLNAACVPEKYHKDWLETLNISENIYVTTNKHDRNLNGAKIILWQHQLGERPHQPFADKAVYVNFSAVLSNEHNYFLIPSLLAEKPFIKDFYKSIFMGRKVDLNNTHFKPASKEIPNQVKCYLPEKNNTGFSLGL